MTAIDSNFGWLIFLNKWVSGRWKPGKLRHVGGACLVSLVSKWLNGSIIIIIIDIFGDEWSYIYIYDVDVTLVVIYNQAIWSVIACCHGRKASAWNHKPSSSGSSLSCQEHTAEEVAAVAQAKVRMENCTVGKSSLGHYPYSYVEWIRGKIPWYPSVFRIVFPSNHVKSS